MQESEDDLSSESSNESSVTVPLLQPETMSTPGASTGTTGTAAPVPTITVVQNTLGGKTYTVRAITDPKPISADSDIVLHAKEDRDNLTADDRASIFEKAVKLQHKQYDLMPLSLEDADKLDDAYNLDVLIKYTKQSHYIYDMQDVFLIVYPKTGNQANVVDYTKDLYTEYPDITIEDVARSNEWYRTWMNEKWFVQNLQLTHNFFQNNVSDDLWMKVSETYETFSSGEKGGPLFFIIMMNHLLSDTEEAASALVTKVKTFEIRKITGEDIYKVVSLLRGAINRLTYIHKLPEEMVKILLQVFQTTSVDDFNATFSLIEKQRKQQAVLRRTGTGPDLLCADIFKIAESEYRDMLTLNTWTGAHTTGDSVFHAGAKPGGTGLFEPTCFNCNGLHHIKQCTKPRDKARIDKKAGEFRAMLKAKFARNGNAGGSAKNTNEGDKWAAPLPHENNRRSIDGKPMFYLRSKKRWVPDRDTVGAKPAANVATKTKKKKKKAEEAPAEEADDDAEPDRVHMANRFKQLQATFTALSNDMLKS